MWNANGGNEGTVTYDLGGYMEVDGIRYMSYGDIVHDPIRIDVYVGDSSGSVTTLLCTTVTQSSPAKKQWLGCQTSEPKRGTNY